VRGVVGDRGQVGALGDGVRRHVGQCAGGDDAAAPGAYLLHDLQQALGDDDLRRNLAGAEELARAACAALEADDPAHLGGLMNDQWALKRERLAGVPMERVELLREAALEAGAVGAMLVGAGGGGYLLVYAPDPEPVRRALDGAGAPELGFGLDEHGCVTE